MSLRHTLLMSLNHVWHWGLAETAPFARAFSQAVPWLLVLTGWYISRRDNNWREERREIRGVTDAVIKEIEDLEHKGHEYYLSAPGSHDAIRIEFDLIRGLDRLDTRVEKLRAASDGLRKKSRRPTHAGRSVSGEPDKSNLFVFTDALTGGDFREAARVKRDFASAKMMDISLAAKELAEEMESEYSHIFSGRTPFL